MKPITYMSALATLTLGLAVGSVAEAQQRQQTRQISVEPGAAQQAPAQQVQQGGAAQQVQQAPPQQVQQAPQQQGVAVQSGGQAGPPAVDKPADGKVVKIAPGGAVKEGAPKEAIAVKQGPPGAVKEVVAVKEGPPGVVKEGPPGVLKEGPPVVVKKPVVVHKPKRRYYRDYYEPEYYPPRGGYGYYGGYGYQPDYGYRGGGYGYRY